jgi:hypothetical protein
VAARTGTGGGGGGLLSLEQEEERAKQINSIKKEPILGI